MGTADRALATFLSAHDLPFRSFCSCDPLWAKLVRAIQKAGPLYKPAKYQKLAEITAPSNGARAGGLYLAKQVVDRRKREITSAAVGTAVKEGGTLVSDGPSAVASGNACIAS